MSTKKRIKQLEEKMLPPAKMVDIESSILRDVMGLKPGEVIRIKHSKGYEKLVLKGIR